MSPSAFPTTTSRPYQDARPSERPVPAICLSAMTLTHGLATGPKRSFSLHAALWPAMRPCLTAVEPSWLMVGPGMTADSHCIRSPAM